MSIVKRFIAGAVCPRCAQMDAVRMYRDDEREYRECVKCGFEDSLRLDGRPDHEELETRVNQPRADKAPSASDAERDQVQVINFNPNPGQNRRDH
ncbi:YheV family putative zinc ribbon protein [Marinobacterium zhoushanense]|nr:YheV family putative zinc ribbon protein [Marinobacterium zhoushanense]